MANNLSVGPNSVVAKQTISFADAGVTSGNTAIIYKVGNPNQSYIPGRSINPITGFELNSGYYMVMLQAVDFSAFLVPPVSGGGNTTPAAPTAGVVDDSANTFNWTNSSGFTALSDYEFTLNGGSTYADVTAKPIVVGDVAKAIGQVGVRVKAATGRNVSATLYNATAFNASAQTLLASDDFNRAEVLNMEGQTTPVGSKTWVKVNPPGGWMGVIGNMARLGTADTTTSIFTIDVGTKNVDFRATMGPISTNLPGAYLKLRYVSGNEVQVDLVTGETKQILSSTPTTKFPGSGTSVSGDVMRAVINNNTVTVYRNGTQIGTATDLDPSLTSTAFGIMFFQDDDTFINSIELYTA